MDLMSKHIRPHTLYLKYSNTIVNTLQKCSGVSASIQAMQESTWWPPDKLYQSRYWYDRHLKGCPPSSHVVPNGRWVGSPSDNDQLPISPARRKASGKVCVSLSHARWYRETGKDYTPRLTSFCRRAFITFHILYIYIYVICVYTHARTCTLEMSPSRHC